MNHGGNPEIADFEEVIYSTLYDLKPITADSGTESAGHETIAEMTEAEFYFAKPYRSWDHGLNDHTNKLIRRFYRKAQASIR